MAEPLGPFDAPHFYIQWGGRLPGNETWSCGMRMTSDDVGQTNSTGTAGVVGNFVKTFHQDPQSQISPNAKLSFVKFNAIGVDGHYIFPETFETVYADLPGGGAATPVYPNQIALAISLTTGFTRGPAHRGRFYIPLPTMDVDANGVISIAAATSVGLATDLLIAGLNQMNPDRKCAVFSRKLGAPSHRVITGCEVGRVLDTQRRRRRSLIEDHR